MLGNVQYATFYKFLVSLGLVLVAFALVIPWLLLHESFDLLIKQVDLLHLTPTAQRTIRHRQAIVEAGSLIAPWLSVGLFLGGIGLSAFGVARWRQRQEVMDRTEDLHLEKLQMDINLMPATPLERDAKQSSEAWQAIREQSGDSVPALYAQRTTVDATYRSLKHRMTMIEDLAIAKLEAAFALTHDLTPQMKLDTEGIKLWIDALLTARDAREPDFAVEIKFVTHQTGAGKRAHEAIQQASLILKLYTESTGRRVQPLVLFIVAGPDRHSDIGEWTKATERQISRLPSHIKATVVPEARLRRLSPVQLRALLLGDKPAAVPNGSRRPDDAHKQEG